MYNTKLLPTNKLIGSYRNYRCKLSIVALVVCDVLRGVLWELWQRMFKTKWPYSGQDKNTTSKTHLELAKALLPTISEVLDKLGTTLNTFALGVDEGVEIEKDVMPLREERIGTLDTVVVVVVEEELSSVLESDNLLIGIMRYGGILQCADRHCGKVHLFLVIKKLWLLLHFFPDNDTMFSIMIP